MELKLLTKNQVGELYRRDLTASFPPAERKPLPAIERLMDAGSYEAWGLMDGEEIVGCAFLWMVRPGWLLIDYLCVPETRRNGGLGGEILRRLLAQKRGSVLMGEAETPEYAPDPAVAARRLEFYRRCGARFAGYPSQVFGVFYQTFYWADVPVPDEELARRHAEVYRRSFLPEKYRKYVHIPWNTEDGEQPVVPWDE